jgi:hypothetical protein
MSRSTDQLLVEIEAFLVTSGMSPTMFGIQAMSDGTFFKRLKSGGSVTLTTADRLRDFMASYESRESKSADGKSRPSLSRQEATA